jgi:hypothetical protein
MSVHFTHPTGGRSDGPWIPTYSRARAFPPRSTRPVHRPGPSGRRDQGHPLQVVSPTLVVWSGPLRWVDSPGGPGSRPIANLVPSPPGTRDPSIGRDHRAPESDLEFGLEARLIPPAARGSRPMSGLVPSPPGARNRSTGRDRRVANRRLSHQSARHCAHSGTTSHHS